MEFRDFSTAAGHYAQRYAEYAAGRLHPEQLQRERAALVVVDGQGRRWGLDASGQWTPVAAQGSSGGVPRWLLGVIGGLAVAVFAAAGLMALRQGDAGPGAGAGAGPVQPPTTAATAPAPPPVEGLVGQLRSGGYVLYLRHAARTDDETVVTDPTDCSQQANLTEEGRAQAARLGEAFRALAIPAGPVYASPYCRTTETAQLAFGTVTPVPELAGGTSDPPVDPAAQRRVLEGLLGETVAGSNVIIVGHSEVIAAVTGENVENFAESVVFQPQGDGTYRVVAHVLYEQVLGWVESCPPACS